MLINNFSTFLIGCCFGSFINVLIYRLPLKKSILFPGSHCTKCNYKIAFYDNIPILSWFFLKGKCRNCREKISIIYPLVETITGLLFLFNNNTIFSRFFIGSQPVITIFGCFFISILLTLSILDIKYLWLPSSICKFGILLGICLSILLEIRHIEIYSYLLITETILATFIGYLFFEVIRIIGLNIYKKPVMGKGDANLGALLGSWLGFKGLFISIWFAFNFAGLFSIIGLITKRLKKGQKIPFGSFLALSGLCVWYFGNYNLSKIVFIGK